MSGICGILRLDGTQVQKKDFRHFFDAMQHRGSDREGVWINNTVALGHKALWSTPESLHEQQPLMTHDGRYVLTADARIDNRKELFDKLDLAQKRDEVVTDADLILLAWEKWEEKCPEYLLGDFAFVIYDKKKKKIFCTRDHVGIRPFYYYIDEQQFCFSSEINPLFFIPSIEKIKNDKAIEFFKKNAAITYEETFFKDIKRLPPGHKMVLYNQKISIQRYWFPEKLKIDKTISFQEASEKLKTLLHSAVQARLRSAYPIGCTLSGGLDSSSVLCLAANMKSGQKITALSERYGNMECDESYYSDLVVKLTNLDLLKVDVDKLDYNQAYSLKKYFEMFPDWPTYGSFIGALPLAQKAKEQNIRIVLTGHGGDHVVSGNLYGLGDYLKKYQFGKLYKELKYYGWSKKIIKRYVLKPVLPRYIFTIKELLRFRRYKKIQYKNDFFKIENFDIGLRPFSFIENIRYIIGTSNAFWMDSNVYHNIEKYNIEARHPFFDVRLIEFCLSLPEEYKIQYGISKRVLREAMKNILPEAIRSRTDKAEFSEPVMKQIKEEFKHNHNTILKNILKESICLGIIRWKERNFYNEEENICPANTYRNWQNH